MKLKIITFKNDRTVERLKEIDFFECDTFLVQNWSDMDLSNLDSISWDKVVIRYDWRGFNDFLVYKFLNEYKKKLAYDKKLYERLFPFFADKYFLYMLIIKSNVQLQQPDTIISNSIQEIKNSDFEFPLVVKKRKGGWAQGVYLINNKSDLAEVFERYGGDVLLIQKYINFVKDLRITLIRGEILSVKVRTVKFPNGQVGKVRYNGEDFILPKMIEKEVIKLSEILGSECLGVDMGIDSDGNYYIIEVNVSPGFFGLSQENFEKAWRLLI